MSSPAPAFLVAAVASEAGEDLAHVRRILERYVVVLASASPRRREILGEACSCCCLPTSIEEEIPESRKEDWKADSPATYVMELSAVKARDISERIAEASRSADGSSLDAILGFERNGHSASELLKLKLSRGILVVAADTTVCTAPAEGSAEPGLILDKPETEERARATLRQLSGRAHTALTGVSCVLLESAGAGGDDGSLLSARSAAFPTFCDKTAVVFKPLAEAAIDAYVATGLPLDKAGAYGIQHDVALAGGDFDLIERLEGSFLNVMGFPLGRFAREVGGAPLLQGSSEEGTTPATGGV